MTEVVPLLGALLVFPLYDAVILSLPSVVSVYEIEQRPADRIHSLFKRVNRPVLLEEEKRTLPVGDEPVTTTVQFVGVLDKIVEGEQDTFVVVGESAGSVDVEPKETCGIMPLGGYALILIQFMIAELSVPFC